LSLKVALLFSNYGPYHLARIEGFFNAVQIHQWQVCGIELARSETEYPWQTEISSLPFPIYAVLPDRRIEQVSFLTLVKSLHQLLNQVQPDVIAISGYARPAMLAALLWCRWLHKPTILFSETTEADFVRSSWKENLKRLLISQYQAALVGGQPQKRYLIQLGMDDESIFLGYNVVGNGTFHPSHIRTLLKPLQKPYFLTINRFVHKKNLPSIISAYATYRQMAGDKSWDLVLCGDGELRSLLEKQIQDLGLASCIHLPGFLQQNEQLPYFAHAGCFIHASTHEQWGLVVNEAMAAGLPVLVSNRCGCFEDLVIEGVNGFGFDPEHPKALAELMLKMSSGELDLTKFGQASLSHIQKFSPDYLAQGLIRAVRHAINRT
jgi:glycosyltransferase involved in cell wall biosynthesis